MLFYLQNVHARDHVHGDVRDGGGVPQESPTFLI